MQSALKSSANVSRTRCAFRSARRSLLPPTCAVHKNGTSPSVPETSKRTDALNELAISLAVSAPFLFNAPAALAKDGELGLLEGRTAALIHPAIMFGLFAATGYAGYLGWQWRRVREVGEEIKELKKQLPAANAEGVKPASPLDSKVASLEQERKDLVAGNYRDKHFLMGSVLLGAGVTIAIEGAVNTYIRTGKLFPGPHLFAGAGMVAIWALAAALVPAMQKGNDGARSAHIALNAVNVGLFLWQVPTGLEIVGKVFQFTQWP